MLLVQNETSLRHPSGHLIHRLAPALVCILSVYLVQANVIQTTVAGLRSSRSRFPRPSTLPSAVGN